MGASGDQSPVGAPGFQGPAELDLILRSPFLAHRHEQLKTAVQNTLIHVGDTVSPEKWGEMALLAGSVVFLSD